MPLVMVLASGAGVVPKGADAAPAGTLAGHVGTTSPVAVTSPVTATSAAGAASAYVPPRPPSRAQVLAAVQAEWSRYDGGGKGRLTPLEFGTWVMQSHGATVAPAGVPKGRGKGIPPTSAMNASATAFARADANHDGGITPDEMTNFLMLPPAPTALERAAARKASPVKPAMAGKTGPKSQATTATTTAEK